MLAAGLLTATVSACGQDAAPEKPDSSTRPPVDRGMRSAPEPSTGVPQDSATIVVPPKTDPAAVTPPPKNVDPGINGGGDIDRKSREQTEKLQQKH